MINRINRYLCLLGTHAFLSGLLAVLALAAAFPGALPVRAEGGIAISGTFYNQNFEIPQGSSASGLGVYIVVFNNTSDQLLFKMTDQVPSGVQLVLSEREFTLDSGGQKQVTVGVEVGNEAFPGDYEISVTAEHWANIDGVITLTGAPSQKASLKVLSKSGGGGVKVRATSPDEQPVTATIRLYRIVSGKEYEVAYSEDGSLEVLVAAGSYVARSYLAGEMLSEEQFDIAANETKEITLSGETVYFEAFTIVPNYPEEGSPPTFVGMVYTIKNLYETIESSEVVLLVSRDGTLLEETVLVSLPAIGKGRTSLDYNYIPDSGWEDGTYDFQLRLNIDGEFYAESSVEQLTVSSESNTAGSEGLSPVFIGVIAGAVLVVAAAGLLIIKRPRRR